jgi:integrase/recombinase XerD
MPESPSQFRLPRYFTQPQLTAFFAVIGDPRDRTLFSLIYLYGLRVGEVSLLRRQDVDLVRQRIVVKRLKGGFWSERPLFAACGGLLAKHLGEQLADSVTPLFPGRAGSLRKRQIQVLFVRYRDAAGLPRYLTAHSLRHSIATHLLDAGASLEFIQDHLGHQSIRSTSIYARITDRHRVAQFQRLEDSPWIVHPASVAPDPSPRASKEVSP